MDDNRKTIKNRLSKIKKKNNIDYQCLNDVINRTNKLVKLCYLFSRSYIIYVIENGLEEPEINETFYKVIFSVLSSNNKPKKGRPFNKNVQNLIDRIKNYNNIFKQKINYDVIDATNLSYVLGPECEKMYNSVINNIIYHFNKHVWLFVKVNFEEKLKVKEMRPILSDLISNNQKSTHIEWINKYRANILPDTFKEKTFERDVKRNTFQYLKSMNYINKFVQKMNKKSYQFYPIRTAFYNKYIKINTSALIDIFIKENKIEKFNKSGNEKFQKELWSTYFNTNYKIKNFSFNYEIETDGLAVSLNMISKNGIEIKEKLKAAKRKGRQQTNQLKINSKSEEQYRQYLKDKNKKNTEKDEKLKEKRKEISKQRRQDYKKLDKTEQDKIKYKLNEKSEFPYIGKLIQNPEIRDTIKDDFEKGKLIFCDPGKRSILYMMASNKVINKPDEGLNSNKFGITEWNDRKFMNYTSKTRNKFTKRNKYQSLINNWKYKRKDGKKSFYKVHRIAIDYLQKMIDKLISKNKKLKNKKQIKNNKKQINKYKKDKRLHYKLMNDAINLKGMEAELSLLNSKSCDYSDFINYINKKLEYNKLFEEQYDDTYIRKLRWFSYINKQKHEDNLVNVIKNEFGSDVKIIIGDWSNKGHIKYISTPNLGLKRKLKKYFKVYLIDEYLTSKIHYKHNVKCENIKIPDKKDNKLKDLHAVLSFQLDSKSGCKISGCINRDKNSVLNMERIVKSLIDTGERPDIFKRQLKPVVS